MVKSFLCGLTLGGIGAVMSMQYHIVRTPEKHLIVSRIHQPPLRSAYVDVREWTPAMWQQFPELSEAMMKAGYSELLARDGRVLQQASPVSQTIPQQTGPAPGQAANPFTALPTSLIRSNPPTAWPGFSPAGTAGKMTAQSSTVPMPVQPIHQPSLTDLVNPPHPYPADVQPPAQALPANPQSVIPFVPQPEQNEQPVVPSSEKKPSWFGSILKSVIPEVGQSIRERSAEAQAFAANVTERWESMTKEMPEMVASAKPEEPKVSEPAVTEPAVELVTMGQPIPESPATPAAADPGEQSYVPVPTVISRSPAEFPASPYRIPR